jgi:hypothetical protein
MTPHRGIGLKTVRDADHESTPPGGLQRVVR